jgi:hypothetical protein
MTDNDTLVWLVPSVLVVVGFAVGLVEYWGRSRQQLLIDLQGKNSAAAAAVALRVRDGKFPKRVPMLSKRRRRELFQALCLAAVFERSGRSRSLIYSALSYAGGDAYDCRYQEEIREIVDRTTVTVSRGWAYTDLSRARKRLSMLRAALGFDGDVRLRLDSSELNARTARGAGVTPDLRLCDNARHGRTVSPQAFSWAAVEPVVEQLRSIGLIGPDLRLYDNAGHGRKPCLQAFSWAALEPVVEQLGSVVLIGPPQSGHTDVVIALGYHRAARPVGGATKRTEQLVLTRLGHQVVLAKYGWQKDAIARLADRLAEFIQAHPNYRDAACVAAVPGSLSTELGMAVHTRIRKPLVEMCDQGLGPAGLGRTVATGTDKPLAPASDAEAGQRRMAHAFAVKDESRAIVRGKTVILVDDVYRSGRMLQTAAAFLESAGAREILGLTVTCTVSAADAPCSRDIEPEGGSTAASSASA